MNGHGRERPLQLHAELLQRSGCVVSDRRLPVRTVFLNNKIGGFLQLAELASVGRCLQRRQA